ncbi:hypothetical protein BU23DRAFT_88440 [Bimuria novae-zelandiae CBS 107.79]|uniref:Uncharacterized protein n=1 Tax=Bimuria novae-zelandiae CBS 107.79 TaxID=1447943 RepID=A0A6A5UH53_9PLEO|nr:hypothetical protein BU23DRAFT_88440 [Bimuria novae-zelandiae CBS 107.79]
MYPRVQFVASNTGCPTETINIWSHLLGTIWFCFSTTIFISNRPPSLRNTIILLCLMASALCFWCSTMYHMFASHPQAGVWQYFDHIGIVAIIWSSAVSFVFFSFEDQEELWKVYLLLTNLATLLCLIRLSWIQALPGAATSVVPLLNIAVLTKIYWVLRC